MSGESVSGRADQLRSAASAVPSGAVNELSTNIENLRDQLVYLVGDDTDEVVGHAQQLADAATGLFRNLVALRGALNAVATYHAGTVPPVGGGGSGNGGASAGSSGPRPVTAPDGSQYPAAAGWVADIMPPRVRTGQPGQKTIGYADGQIGQQFTSGNDQAWSPLVETRLRERGESPSVARRLKSHVELKVAARMVQRGQTHSELVINHVPCGSTQGATGGCHDTLAKFLPEGTTLTVHGTTQQGMPYSHTHRGSA